MEVNNKILSFFWNNFDYLIRFVYCKTSFLSGKLLFWKLYSSNFKSLDNIFENMFLILQKNKISLKNKTVLELGPGNSYIIAYNFLMQGIKKAILVDKFPRIIENKKQIEYFNKELEFIKGKYGKVPFFVKKGILDSKYLKYLSKELTEINIDKVDFIYSNSVLEHVKNAEENIASMSKILNSGGYMYHNIDLRDHYNFNKPFLFYKYEDSTWNKYLSKEGVSYTNRLRYDDFINLFKKYGFEIIYEKVKKQKLNQKKLSSRFRNKSKDVLEITNLNILLRKVK